MTIQTIAVLGAGTMGHGIAHVAALAGATVRLYDIAEPAVDKGLASIRRNMDKGVDRGKLAPEARDAAWPRISGSTDLAAAVNGADLVVEAVPEKLELKRSLFAQVEPHLADHAILGTNTNYLLGPWLENAKCVWVVVCSSNQPDSTLCAISWFCLTLQELGKHTCRAKPSGVQRPEPNHALG